MYQLHITQFFADGAKLRAPGQDFTGTGGDDPQDGTAGNDRFFYDQGGNDTLNGLGGNDVFQMGAAFNAGDAIDGGTGNDTIVLDGDYNLALTNATMSNVETVRLTAAHDYSLTLAVASLFNVASFTFDASALGAGDSASLDTGASTGGNIQFKGGAGADVFRFGLGFSGQFNGAGGDDTVEFAAGATSQMLVNGGAGHDTVQIDVFANNGASPHIALGANAIANVETLGIVTNRDFVSLRMNDANVAAGKTLTVLTLVNDGACGFNFDGTRETNGHFDVSGGGSDDVLSGGALSDTFHLDAASAAGGSDAVFGEAGDDTIYMGATLENTDLIDGGDGNDTLDLKGNYTGSDAFVPDAIHSIETIVLEAGFNYLLFLNSANIDPGATLTVDGTALTAANSIDVRAENTQGHLTATGGAGGDTFAGGDLNDHLIGGAGSDTLIGRLGADTLEGDSGDDYYFLYQPDNSTGPNYDTFVTFNADDDSIVTRNAVDAIDNAVNAGTLRTASFNGDLVSAIGSAQLGAHHAVLFRPTVGLTDHTFLIIDDNGVAGYQADADFVIDITGAKHLGDLSGDNFGPLVG